MFLSSVNHKKEDYFLAILVGEYRGQSPGPLAEHQALNERKHTLPLSLTKEVK
jgi:hypothetical protein